MLHELKVQTPWFDHLLSGEKTFEVRRNDRGFQKGDTLLLREVTPPPCKYTDRQMRALVTFVYTASLERAEAKLAACDDGQCWLQRALTPKEKPGE